MERIFHKQGMTIIVKYDDATVIVNIIYNTKWYNLIVGRTSLDESIKLYNVMSDGFCGNIDITHSINNDIPTIEVMMFANNAHIRIQLKQQFQPYTEYNNIPMHLPQIDPDEYITKMIEQLSYGFTITPTPGDAINIQTPDSIYEGYTISNMFKQMDLYKIYVVDITCNQLCIVNEYDNTYRDYSYKKLSDILNSLNQLSSIFDILFWVHDHFMIVTKNTIQLIETMRLIHL